MVGLERLELSTSRLSGVRSSHLSYRPVMLVFFPAGRVSCAVLLSHGRLCPFLLRTSCFLASVKKSCAIRKSRMAPCK